ncbi:MAG: hypothetical protein WBD40_22220 [Tepidisphaeraceae bacterium]
MTDPPADDEIPFGDPSDGDGPGDGYDDGDRPEDRVDPADMMSPPKVPCECYCLHCQRVFMSDGIWFQKVINARDGFDGFWMCPTPNCDGAGFTFDIFPTDPTHPANGGWHYSDDEDDEDLEFDDEGNVIEATRERDYDPDESKYKALDEEMGPAEDDIIEGDEWKLAGLEPGEGPKESDEQREARLRWEEEQKRYDAPDERPRVLDWNDRNEEEASGLSDEDIPF